MHSENRPDADALLARVKKEEAAAKRGKLKIFFGMAAGVGKTYAMLSEAQNLLDEGADIVIGIIETHGRIETIARTEGIPILPRRKINVNRENGEVFVQEEMDLDRILERKPAYVLVDELAHTNAPDSRHPKRYMDVEELLDRGINVYSTLNVQHLESVADFVEQITGSKVQERVPDAILDTASEIELIDISPEELRKRLSEGKVYRSERAAVAAHHFFRPENLLALREMALQTTARLVDSESLRRRSAGEVLRTRERILVLVGTDRFASRLIRIARRMAADLRAPWYVLHVRQQIPNAEERDRLEKEFSLARSLGAEVLLIDGEILEAVEQVVSERSITQIVVGRTEKRFVRLRRSVTSAIIERITGADIHIVPMKRDLTRRRPTFRWPSVHSEPRDYAAAAIAIGALASLCKILIPVDLYTVPSIIFIAAVAALGLVLGRGPVLFASALAAVLWNFLFIPPVGTFVIGKFEDRLTFLLFFAVAIVTGSLTSRLRKSKTDLMRRQHTLIQLQEISQYLTAARRSEEIAAFVCSKLDAILDCAGSAVFIKSDQLLHLMPSGAEVESKDRTIAEWVIEHGRPAGRGTDTLPLASAAWIPLKTQSQTVRGALRIPKELSDLTEMNLVRAIAAQASVALERTALSRQAQQAEIHEESEKLFHAILRSVSHELRSPVTAMLAAAENLSRENVMKDDALRNEVRLEIESSSQRLARVVDQLLAMSRIESGRLTLQKEKHDLRDLVRECLDQLARDLAGHAVEVEAPTEPVTAWLDFALMRQAISGILHNASLHTPHGTSVIISLRQEGDNAVIAIVDNGPGIEGDASRLFEPFYRGSGAKPGGLGLGLSIARSVIELHGGRIHVKSTAYGTRFQIEIPCGEGQ